MSDVKKVLTLVACGCMCLMGATSAWGQVVGATTDNKGDELTAACRAANNLTICNVFVNMANVGDRVFTLEADVFQVFDGNTPAPLFQVGSIFGGDTAPSSGFFEFDPNLPCDSFVTIGLKDSLMGDETVLGICNPEVCHWDGVAFNSIGLTDGFWFHIDPNNGQGDAGADKQVLIMQASFPVGFRMEGTAQVFWEALGGNGSAGSTTVTFECAAECIEGESCADDGDCDDGNQCTDNTCGGGCCVTTNNNGPCDDGKPCTVGESCSGGDCTGGDDPCPEGFVCDPITTDCVEVTGFLDIKPGSCPNPFNRHGNGVLPVALVGTVEFDAAQVDLSTLRLSRADGVGGSVAPNEGPPGPRSMIKDAARPFDGDPCDCQHHGPDGIDDLSMKFRTRNLVDALELNDLSGGAVVELLLSGSLLDGTPFVAGDCIVIVPPGNLAPANAFVGSNVSDTFVAVTPIDLNFDGDGFASFSRSYYNGSALTLTAPARSDSRRFVRWSVDGVLQEVGVRTLELFVDQDVSLRAIYKRGRRPRPDRPMEDDGSVE